MKNNLSTILYLPICTKRIELQKSVLLMECQNEHKVSNVVNAQQKRTAFAIITVRYVVVKLFPCLQYFADSEMKWNETELISLLF